MVWILTLLAKAFFIGALATCGAVTAMVLIALVFSAMVEREIDKLEIGRAKP